MKSTTKTKSFSKNEEDILNNELKILSLLDHPNIIKVFSFYSNEDSYSYMAEYCEEGDLNEQLLNKGAYDEKTAAYIMHQIFSAINYCHKNKIINRELVLENILVSEIKNDLPTVKMGYFGTSYLAKKNAIKIKRNTNLYYIPPEANTSFDKYFDKSDIWSCGVIMYFLLAARPPFAGENEEEKQRNIFNKNYDIIKCLKKGAYSDIYLVENKLSKLRCIMKSTTKTKSFSKNEEDILNRSFKRSMVCENGF